MMQELSNHLWQSTAFAVAVGLLTLAFRRNRASVRHALWLSASVKFLVPFSVFFALGLHLWPGSGAVSTPVLAQSVSRAVVAVSEPFPSASFQLVPTQQQTHWGMLALLTVWACGFAGVALVRLRTWLRLRRVIRGSVPIDIGAPIEVRSSTELLEPGVVGWLHPILLVPHTIQDHLTTAQMEAVLAHELCHVRRRDNLAAAIHIAVETIFWFHPLVWWIGGRLIEERERACDEEVLRLGTEPELYAGAILKICRLYMESPLACHAGIGGSNLRRRIAAILANRIGLRVGTWGTLALAAAGTLAVCGPVAIGMMQSAGPSADQSTPAFEQGQGSHLAFEVASVKPAQPSARAGFARATGVGSVTITPDRAMYQDITLKSLIMRAYGLKSFQVSGPAWMDSERYDVVATIPEGTSKGDVSVMLQHLLADRFHMKLHTEMKKHPGYILGVGKGDLKLKTSAHPRTQEDSGLPDSIWFSLGGGPSGQQIFGATMSAFANLLSNDLGSPVIDSTGLVGKFDFTLPISPMEIREGPQPDGSPADPNASSESIFTALHDLGLTLVRDNVELKFIVIDKAQKVPVEN